MISRAKLSQILREDYTDDRIVLAIDDIDVKDLRKDLCLTQGTHMMPNGGIPYSFSARQVALLHPDAGRYEGRNILKAYNMELRKNSITKQLTTCKDNRNPTKVLRLSTMKEVEDFDDKYGETTRYGKNNTKVRYINWDKVKSDFAGVEFFPYPPEGASEGKMAQLTWFRALTMPVGWIFSLHTVNSIELLATAQDKKADKWKLSTGDKSKNKLMITMNMADNICRK